jgi:hypothetical protein
MMTTNGLGSSYLFVVVARTTQRFTSRTLTGSSHTRSGAINSTKDDLFATWGSIPGRILCVFSHLTFFHVWVGVSLGGILGCIMDLGLFDCSMANGVLYTL